MKGSVGGQTRLGRSMPVRNSLVRTIMNSLPPTPRVKVRQEKIPGMGTRSSRRKHSRETVVRAKLMDEAGNRASEIAVALGVPIHCVVSWCNGISCADWEPTKQERLEFNQP